MKIFLLTRTDIEKRLAGANDRDNSEEKVGLCPVVELFELCEAVKKNKSKVEINWFRSGMQTLLNDSIARGEIIVINLDQLCLARSLFDREEENVVDLWPAAANNLIAPSHSIRRLLLRPSDQTWWDDEIYAESEAIYVNGEPGHNV